MEIVIYHTNDLNKIRDILEYKNFIVHDSSEHSACFKGRSIFQILFLSMLDSFNAIQNGSFEMHNDAIKIKANINVFMIANITLVSMFNIILLMNIDGSVDNMVILVLLFSCLLIPYSYFFTKYQIRNKIIRLLEKGEKDRRFSQL